MKLWLFLSMLLSFSLVAMNNEKTNKVPPLDLSGINVNDRTASPRRKRGMSCPLLPRSFASDNLRSPLSSPTSNKQEKHLRLKTNN